jgi:hypothetical protein
LRLFRIENLYWLGMWAVSLALAFFLVGLGSLVVQDLPRVDQRIEIEDFVDPEADARLDAEVQELAGERTILDTQLEPARFAVESRQADTAAARDAFEAWIATRTATGDAQRDAELVERTEELTALREAEREAFAALNRLLAREREISERQNALLQERTALREAARGRFQTARFAQEARVFGLRLAITLPLLVAGLWALKTRRRSPLWPLWRGFVIFAAFTFFVELVPYLPSYGGYVHYGVGAIATVVLGAWLIRAARRHLAKRAEEAARSEDERRAAIVYEDALRKVAADTCPSCERTLRTVDGQPINHCVHCGLKLYEACPGCGARRLVFFPFCMNCGAPGPEPAAGGALPAAQPRGGSAAAA